MTRLTYHGERYELEPGETVLSRLERARLPVRSSCRSGACQACVLKVGGGAAVPSRAQQGLRESARREGYFLSCQWAPDEDVEVFDAMEATRVVAATIAEVRRENAFVWRVWLTPAQGTSFAYEAGQFVHVERPSDGVSRAYSLASVAELDPRIELHVRRIDGGAVSPWLTEAAAIGRTVRLRGPLGTCTYDERIGPDELLVLAGISTGLGPLVAVVRQALRLGHVGPIHLYAGSAERGGLYLRDELARLARAHKNLTVHACVLRGDPPFPSPRSRGGPTEDVRVVDVADAILADHPNLRRARAFLCGAADWVGATKKRLFMAGMPLKSIASDAFVPTGAIRGA